MLDLTKVFCKLFILLFFKYGAAKIKLQKKFGF